MAKTVMLSCYASDNYEDGRHSVEIIHEREDLTRGRCACGSYRRDGMDLDLLRSINAKLRGGRTQPYYLIIQSS